MNNSNLEKKVSIIIPVYKAESFIRKNLMEIKQIANEHFPNHELIVVIDGEVDHSKSEAEKVDNIKILSYKKNKGKGFALLQKPSKYHFG